MIRVLLLVLTISGPLIAAPALKLGDSVSIAKNGAVLTSGKLSNEAKNYIAESQVVIGMTFSFALFGVEPSYETYENVIYNRALAFLNLTIDTQKELHDKFSNFGEESSGVDHTALNEIMNELKEHGDDLKWLDAASEKFYLANSTLEFVEYVKEEKPKLGARLEKMVTPTMEKYDTVSEEGKRFLKKAFQYLMSECQKNFPEETGDDQIDKEQLYRNVHGMFMELSKEAREEVLRKMTWFVRPLLQKQFAVLMAEMRKISGTKEIN